jgi:hypothetical protein
LKQTFLFFNVNGLFGRRAEAFGADSQYSVFSNMVVFVVWLFWLYGMFFAICRVEKWSLGTEFSNFFNLAKPLGRFFFFYIFSYFLKK